VIGILWTSTQGSEKLSPKLEHFVELVREKLSTPDFETKRMALEMLDIKVWIDGDNVEVTGVIPISDYVIVTPQTMKPSRHRSTEKKFTVATFLEECFRL
jgi:hypothetical protein